MPLTTTLAFTWSALLHGERREGHCLHRPERERVKVVWDRLRRLLASHGVPFITARAPEYDARKGLHLHLSAHVPERLLKDVVALVERLTGAPAEFYRAPGSQGYERAPRKKHGWVARSACHGWLVQWNTRPLSGGCADVLGYMSKALPCEQVQSQHRLSDKLSALARLELSERAGRG